VAPPRAVRQADKDSEVFLSRASELKEDGNKHYTARDYKKALACYEQARATTTPSCHAHASASEAHPPSYPPLLAARGAAPAC
jgi:hypothetical protein